MSVRLEEEYAEVVPEISKEQIRIELRRMVDHFRNSLRAEIANADARVRLAPSTDIPDGFLDKWTDTLSEKEAEADALYAQLYRFIEEA